jgi:D-sedoheptulose 7-phosphate isomerase
LSERVNQYFSTLAHLLRDAEVTDIGGQPMPLSEGFDRVRDVAHNAHNAGNKVIYIGNGGSAAIASHLAIDYSKNGGYVPSPLTIRQLLLASEMT